MRFSVKVDIPRAAQVATGLRVDEHVGLRMALTALASETALRDQARRRLSDVTGRVAQVRADVGDGRAAMPALEAVLNEQRAAAIVLPDYDARVKQAEEAVKSAKDRAKRDIVAEAEERRNRLQAAADEVAPLLEALCAAEAALDQAVLAVGHSAGVRSVTWPSSLEDAGLMRMRM